VGFSAASFIDSPWMRPSLFFHAAIGLGRKNVKCFDNPRCISGAGGQ
jgi:hypothetical protein